MRTKNDVVLDKNSNSFLEELRLLRVNNRGKYISNLFCVALEDLSNKMVEIIRQQKHGCEILQPHHLQLPEKMSDKMVELCLECIEIYLQKVFCFNTPETTQVYCQEIEGKGGFNSALQILMHISCDLKALASYIKFTINSAEVAAVKTSKKCAK